MDMYMVPVDIITTESARNLQEPRTLFEEPAVARYSSVATGRAAPLIPFARRAMRASCRDSCALLH